MTGKILATDDEAQQKTINFSQVQVAKISALAYKKEQEKDIEEVVSIFNMSIGKNSDTERIKELQIILSRLSYYNGTIDGKYSKAIEEAIYDFQVENQLLSSKKNLGAGYYGVKTRSKLKEMYALYTQNEKKRLAEEAKLAIEKAAEEKRLALIKAEQEKKLRADTAEVALFVKNFGTPKSDEVGAHVRSLQQSLKSLGYFTAKDTAIFGKNTRSALISYQTDRDISPEEFGRLGKATKEALFRDLFALKTKTSGGLAWNNQ